MANWDKNFIYAWEDAFFFLKSQPKPNILSPKTVPGSGTEFEGGSLRNV
jgi:hypothetical protein